MATYTGTEATNTAVVPYYQTRTYRDLLYAISRLTGITPARLLNDDALAIRDYINSALRTSWEYYPWAPLMSVTSDTVANLDNYAEYDLFSISKYDPRVKRWPTYYGFSEDSGGLNLLDDLATTTTVYLKYRQRFYPFDGIEHSLAESYSNGDMVYDSTTLDYYRSLADSNLGHEVTETAWWDRREIPAFLFEHARLSVVADIREAEGETNKAMILRRQADRARDLEIEKWERQKNQQIRPPVRVRSGG